MTDQQPDLPSLKANAIATLASVATSDQLEVWRTEFLGRKGKVPQFLRSIKELSSEQKKIIGQEANDLRVFLEAQFEERQAQLSGGGTKTTFDVTVPGTRPQLGHLHPLTKTIRELYDIFGSMGFLVADGPLVEELKYNFDYLNIPLEHPARGETDTFYLTNGQILRTHTSPVQIRAVLEHNLTPPFRVISPGVVFRAEKADATHSFNFMQIEALMIGKDLSIANFKSVVETFYSAFFKKKATARLRPSYFPFVEPGFEVDLKCIFCEGVGCKICKQSGWIEMMGAGMVHPSVLKNMNVDSSQWQGFAFGGGIERLAMLKYGIPDVRLFWGGDLRFLTQFS